jgi:hypothetical protein
MPEYEPAFEDEHVKDSGDDRPVPELSSSDKALLQRALTEHALEIPDCQDLSRAHRTVADGLRFDDVSLINHYNIIIQNDIIFKTMEAMKIWLVEYIVFHHRLFMIKHLNENKLYVVTYCCSCL